jgi:hypothetical protein
MNRSVPTLLGILILLVVVVIVVLVYNIQLTKQLGEGGTAMGTVGGQALTGVEAPKELPQGAGVPTAPEARPLTREQQQRRAVQQERRGPEARGRRGGQQRGGAGRAGAPGG